MSICRWMRTERGSICGLTLPIFGKIFATIKRVGCKVAGVGSWGIFISRRRVCRPVRFFASLQVVLARAQQNIGSTVQAQNDVSREARRRGRPADPSGITSSATRSYAPASISPPSSSSLIDQSGSGSRIAGDARSIRLCRRGERPEDGGQPCQGHLPVHDGQAGQERLHHLDAERGDRRARHRARSLGLRARSRASRSSKARRSSARGARNHLRAAGAELHESRGRRARRPLRMRRS